MQLQDDIIGFLEEICGNKTNYCFKDLIINDKVIIQTKVNVGGEYLEELICAKIRNFSFRRSKQEIVLSIFVDAPEISGLPKIERMDLMRRDDRISIIVSDENGEEIHDLCSDPEISLL